MTKTINFCGDSFCANTGEDSWTTILSRLLGYKICGTGKNGASYEHAIKTFDPTATATVFCWTEIHRIYHPVESLNFSLIGKSALLSTLKFFFPGIIAIRCKENHQEYLFSIVL